MALTEKVEQLEGILREHSPLLVAYSGGVDSSYLLAVALKVLGNRVTGVIADSPSLPRKALEKAIQLATQLGANLQVLSTRELEQESYAENPVNRCYFCKAELFQKMEDFATAGDFQYLAYGENADDAGFFRPGMKAAAQYSVIAPLKMAGLTKLEIRELSREINLPTADDAAQPCLSSRIPHGVRVTSTALQMIEQAEEYTRSLGFKVFRVRHLSDSSAKIQIAPSEMGKLERVGKALLGGVKAVGYATVEIDPQGYRSPA